MPVKINNALGDISQDSQKLIGKTSDNKAVIQRVNRVLPKWTGISVNGELLPEVIYKINVGVTSVSLKNQSGLYQLLNNSGISINVGGNFSDGTTNFVLDSGTFLQAECYLDGATYKHTRITALFGGGGVSVSVSPPESSSYVAPSSQTNLLGGSYKLVNGQVYTLSTPGVINTLPVNWFFWLDGESGDVSTVKLNANTDNIPVLFKDTNTWVFSNSNPDIYINADEAVSIQLRNITASERTTATGIIGSFTSNRIYEITTIWRQSVSGQLKNKFGATTSPVSTNDVSEGYSNGSIWNWGDRVWVLVDSKDNDSKWIELTEKVTTQPILTNPSGDYSFRNASGLFPANGFVEPGYYLVQSPQVWGYGSTVINRPNKWVFWNNGTTGNVNLYVSNASNQVLNYNETNNTGGLSLPSGLVSAAPGEIWELVDRELTEVEKDRFVPQFSLTERPLYVRWAKRLTSNTGSLLNVGDRTVIRVAQDIDSRGFVSLRLYLLDNIGLGTYKVFSGGRIIDNSGNDWAGINSSVINGVNDSWVTLPNTKGQYLAYRLDNDLIMWQLGGLSLGIQSGETLPTETSTTIFRLVGHATLPDGLYTRDRNNDWVF